MERPGAGIGNLAVRHLHLKESLALNRQIEWVASLAEVSLKLKNFRSARLGTQTNLQTSGIGSLLRGRRPWHDHVLVQQIGELQAPPSESCRARVGQVIGHVIEIHLLRVHAACSGIQCAEHRAPLRVDLR